jgi:hypothetical protein
MDNNILGIVAIVISVISTIIGVLNHTRVRSACCGTRLEASFDVDRTIPVLPQEESRAS